MQAFRGYCATNCRHVIDFRVRSLFGVLRDRGWVDGEASNVEQHALGVSTTIQNRELVDRARIWPSAELTGYAPIRCGDAPGFSSNTESVHGRRTPGSDWSVLCNVCLLDASS